MDALLRLRERHPGLRAELVLSRVETDLLRREADVAIRFQPEGHRPAPEALVAQKPGDEPFALYATEAYLRRRGTPRDPAVLTDHDVVVYAGRHPASEWCARAFEGANVGLCSSGYCASRRVARRKE